MNIALIVAAGKGTRVGKDIPKQFLLVKDKPLIVYTVEAFQNNLDIDSIVIVTNNDYIKQVNNWCLKYQLNKVKMVVKGGDTRQASVYNGLKAIDSLKDSDEDIILIHDAARPLVSNSIISENIEACIKYDAVDTVIKSKDTIIQSKDNKSINDILNRDEIYQTQTPQSFKYRIIKEAHEKAIKEALNAATDDARLVMALGIDVHLVEGNAQNFKVTNQDDLKMLEALIDLKEK